MLHDWWRRARREPADLTAERLVAETGLFPLAAAGTLGQLRAGALVYLLNAVRGRALEGDTSLAGAVDALETALEWEDAEAPLVPERPNCVRVMNIHRAKGLEAEVVFLAAPFPEPQWAPDKRVSRDEAGVARGSMPIVVKRGWSREVIAQPLGWEEDQQIEAAFEEAETVRLLYVAATRARDELWVARWSGGRGGKPSAWEPIESWVAAEAERTGEGGEGGIARLVALPREDPPVPDVLDPETDLVGQVAAAAVAAARTREPTYRLDTVTARAKGAAAPGTGGDAAAGARGEPASRNRSEDGPVAGRPSPGRAGAVHTGGFTPPPVLPATGGFEWGSVVHAVLAAGGRAHARRCAQTAGARPARRVRAPGRRDG